MALAEQLKASRENKGLSQSDVARKLNITRQSISKWETGKSYPDLDNLVLLSEIYEISIDELLKENQLLKKKINENNETIDESKRRLEWINWQMSGARDDSFLLLVLAIVSCVVPFIGIVIPIVVLKINKPTNTYSTLVKVISVCCLLLSIYNTVLLANNLFFNIGHGTVELVD